jgi:hypothetical protein
MIARFMVVQFGTLCNGGDRRTAQKISFPFAFPQVIRPGRPSLRPSYSHDAKAAFAYPESLVVASFIGTYNVH